MHQRMVLELLLLSQFRCYCEYGQAIKNIPSIGNHHKHPCTPHRCLYNSICGTLNLADPLVSIYLPHGHKFGRLADGQLLNSDLTVLCASSEWNLFLDLVFMCTCRRDALMCRFQLTAPSMYNDVSGSLGYMRLFAHMQSTNEAITLILQCTLEWPGELMFLHKAM